jgi:hypothetical protein
MRSDRILHVMQRSKEVARALSTLSNQHSTEFLYAKRNKRIKWEGPLNIKGWRDILSYDPLKEIFKYENFNNLIESSCLET